MSSSEKILLEVKEKDQEIGKTFSKQSVSTSRKPIQSFICFVSFIFVITLLICSIIFGIQLVDKHFSKSVENFVDIPEIHAPFLSSSEFFGHGQFPHHSHHFCDMCTINPILDEEFVHCHSCDFNQMEEKELACPKSFENMYILNVRVSERKNVELQGLVYNECRKQLLNPGQHKCKINIWDLKFGASGVEEEDGTAKSELIDESAEKEIQRRNLIQTSHTAKKLPCGRMKESGKDTRPGCYEEDIWKMPTKCLDTETDLVPGDCCKHPACDMGGEFEKVTCSDGNPPEVHQHSSTVCEQKKEKGDEGAPPQRGTNQHHQRHRRDGSQQNGFHHQRQGGNGQQNGFHHQRQGENNHQRPGGNNQKRGEYSQQGGEYNQHRGQQNHHQRRGNRPQQNVKSEVWLNQARQSSLLPPSEFLLAQQKAEQQEEEKVVENGQMGGTGNDFGYFPFQDLLTVEYICTK